MVVVYAYEKKAWYLGDHCVHISCSCYNNNCNSYIIHGHSKMNRKKALLFISLLVSGLTLLYLLAVNLFRNTFIYTDWIIITFDLVVKIIIESYILFAKQKKGKVLNIY